MTAPHELGSVRATAGTTADDGRAVPAGMTGAVLEPWPDGSILADFAFTPQAADTDGDFVQGIPTEGQYEIIHVWRPDSA